MVARQWQFARYHDRLYTNVNIIGGWLATGVDCYELSQ